MSNDASVDLSNATYFSSFTSQLTPMPYLCSNPYLARRVESDPDPSVALTKPLTPLTYRTSSMCFYDSFGRGSGRGGVSGGGFESMMSDSARGSSVTSDLSPKASPVPPSAPNAPGSPRLASESMSTPLFAVALTSGLGLGFSLSIALTSGVLLVTLPT